MGADPAFMISLFPLRRLILLYDRSFYCNKGFYIYAGEAKLTSYSALILSLSSTENKNGSQI